MQIVIAAVIIRSYDSDANREGVLLFRRHIERAGALFGRKHNGRGAQLD